ncbi:MAG: hypothetical protein O3C34_19370 [Proteobacteria bacterium]|nr:hypothetical protein [Pseudomonadota bacterium]
MTEDEYMLVRNLQLMTDARLLLEQCVPTLSDVIKTMDVEILGLQKKASNALVSE